MRVLIEQLANKAIDLVSCKHNKQLKILNIISTRSAHVRLETLNKRKSQGKM